ncbi:MAG: DMT family transporter [Alphaproteobacteria bacterium]|nr:DMT family transporter [Alphaproteobacteria bacterium]
MWVALSLLSAFGQALAWALKKKLLANKGINNSIAALSFLVAGVFLVLLHVLSNGLHIPTLSPSFFVASAFVIVANIVAVWTAYRALDCAEFSLLMPFIALSALAIIPTEYILRDVTPNLPQFFGILLLVFGAVFFSFQRIPNRTTLRAIGYFAIAVFSYAISGPFMGIAVEESQSPLFSAAVFHLGIVVGFVPLIFLAQEKKGLQYFCRTGQWRGILSFMLISGFVMAIFENGPATIALASAKASEVFALKRTMPFFALVFGVIIFHERVTPKHVIGTVLLVVGAMLVLWFK